MLQLDEDMNEEVALNSSEIQSSDDFTQFSQSQSQRKEMRQTRIQQKAKERREIVDQVRCQKENQEMDLRWKSIQTMMMMKVMKLLEETDSGDEYDDIKNRLTLLEENQEDTNNKLDSICNLLSEIKESL